MTLVPLQRYGAQLGLCPVAPAASVVHVPFAVAPSAVEHTSQLDPHVLLQQNPSAQDPETH